MYNLDQVFAPGFRGDYANSFRFVFLSEGYTSTEKELFYKDVFNVLDRLCNTYPFSLSKKNPLHFSAYCSFLSSSSHGLPATAPSGTSPFAAYYDSGQNKAFYNYSLVSSVLEQLYFFKDGYQNMLTGYLQKGNNDMAGVSVINQSRCLVIILTPSAGNTHIEAEHVADAAYHFVLTSVDGLLEQLVTRAYARLIGLGDEFDLSGSSFSAPTAQQATVLSSYYPNLTYYASAPAISASSDPDFKWRAFFPPSASGTITVHAHPSGGSSANRTLPTHGVTYKKIEFYEGGGGFRTQVYRSATDCLLRRRIGDASLPVKTSAIGLCPVCTKIIENTF